MNKVIEANKVNKVNKRLLIFAKAPVQGYAKTRLIPALGAVGAANLAKQMLVATLEAAGRSGADWLEIWVTPDSQDRQWAEVMDPWTASVMFYDQKGHDLGARLGWAFEQALADRTSKVVVIGTDCPDLKSEDIDQAFAALEAKDGVIYPAHDGGYVLLGLRQFNSQIFSGISWSTGQVAAQTIAKFHALSWTLDIGPTFQDIDLPEDLAFRKTEPG